MCTLALLWLCFCVTRTAALEGTATAVLKPILRQPTLLASNAGVTTDSASVVANSVVTPVGLVPPPEDGAPKSRRRRLEALFKRPSVPKVAINVLLWWTLNVVFSLCNKQCLNSWPHPWALACSHLAVGTLCMLPLYIPLPSRSAQRVLGPLARTEWVPTRTVPRLGKAELRTLLPVAALLSVGHVTSTLAPAYGTVAFSNIVKTAEPLFTCACSMVLYRRLYSTPVYLALLMVVSGVALVSCRDVNFSSFSLMAGMISNAAFALYSIYAKRAMQAHPEVLAPRTAYALLTMGSLTMLTPLALLMEWSGAGASRLASASTAVGTLRTGWRLVALLGFTGLVQYVSNEIAFCTLSMIHPVTYAVANTLKRSIVVASSLVFFQQSLPATGYAGAFMAIAGAFIYSVYSVGA